MYLGAADNRWVLPSVTICGGKGVLCRHVKTVINISDTTQLELKRNELVLRPTLQDQLFGREYSLVSYQPVLPESIIGGC